MTSEAVRGYADGGGTVLWDPGRGYPGGTVGKWAGTAQAETSRLWSTFESQLSRHQGTQAIWLQLCTAKGNARDGLQSALLVLEEIDRRAPGIDILVSGQPLYTGGHVCTIAGSGGPEFMAKVAASLISEHGLLAGPPQGPLDQSQTRDGCHPSEEGAKALGDQLVAFFSG